MPIETVTRLSDTSARVNHLIPNDLSWSSYYSVVLVDEISSVVQLGTPIACPTPISNLELQSVVQIILGKAVTVSSHPVDTDSQPDGQCIHHWTTFRLLCT